MSYLARARPLVLALFAGLVILPAAAQETLPGGGYTLDPTHTSVSFSVRHLGLSLYTGSFDEITGALEIDPANPGSARLSVAITVASLDLPAPPDGFYDEMMGETWFDAGAHPEMLFESTGVTLTGEESAEIDGVLTLRGVEAPVTLAATFNGGFDAGLIEPTARLGFSATTMIQRSDFGMRFGIPPEGSDFGVGDAVEIRIEAEFTGPPEG